MGRVLGFFFAFMGLALPISALAHEAGQGRAALILAADGTVQLDLKLSRLDVAELLGLPDDAPDAALDALLDTEVPTQLSQWLNLTSEPTPCLWTRTQVAPAGLRGLTITAQASCPVAPRLTVAWPAATRTKLALSLTASVTPPQGAPRWIMLDRENPSAIVDLQAAPPPSAVSFLKLGVEHMLTGWDHLAFLLALVLGCARWRRLLLVVTGFTLAHSLTLALGVLGIITISPEVVEPIIAASIGIAALAALIRLLTGHLAWPGSGRPSGRPVLELAFCFGFGLIHGLGFAGLLAELAPDLQQVFVPLLTFNLGVELGQIVAVSVAFPLLTLVGRSALARPIFAVLLVGLVALGGVVAVQRVLG